ncbi:TPA: hypothetical protein PXR37_003364 [Yersinia enterocolitica]|nr:hypothetical protein [Yersinia enterocolitica]HDL8471346.1 hypothetical protein [Yersinia enterocolitica]
MFYSVIVMADYFTLFLRIFMKLPCVSSPNMSVSSSNQKLTIKNKSPEHSAEIKLSKSKQPQQTDFNCSVSKNLNKIISELERVFNYDDYDKKKSIYMKLWDEINKCKDNHTYVLLEAQAGKGKRNNALSCFLVEHGWRLTHTNTKYPSESRVLDDFCREALCEQALRKLVTRGIQNVIVSIVDKKKHSLNWNANEEQKNQESIISKISYILGLTTDKTDGAKERLGMDPISNIIYSFAAKDLLSIREQVGGENPALNITHTIADSYYRCHSEKENLPSEELIDCVQNEIMETIYSNSAILTQGISSSIDPESSAYRIISKTILDPIISVMYEQQVVSKIQSNTYRENNGKKKSTIEIQKEYLMTDEILDLKSSQIYKDVKNYLLSINENLTEDDITSCAKDYYEFFREKLKLNVPSLAQLEYLQLLNSNHNKNQNKRNGIVFDR